MPSAAPIRSAFPAMPDPGKPTSPVDFLATEHARLIAICARLDRLVDDLYQRGAATEAAAIAAHLAGDFRLHLADEDDDLFPLLGRRCRPEDGFDEIAETAASEHEKDAALVADLLPALERVATARPLERPLDFIVGALTFCELQRRHVAWEEGTVLRLARRRLTADDLDALGRSMAARRGLSPT